VQHDAQSVADFLIDEEFLHVRSLVTGKLDDFSRVLVFLYGTVAIEILFEGLADSLDVQVVGQAGHGGDTFSPVSLLDANVDFLLRVAAPLVVGVLKGVECVELHGSHGCNQLYEIERREW